MPKRNDGAVLSGTIDNHTEENEKDSSFDVKLEAPSISTSLVSGACAGAAAKSVVAPLDRTKIYFQVSNTEFSYRNAISILHQGYKKHGIRNWWRGNSATMARIIPYAAIQFTVYDQIKANLPSKFSFKHFVSGSLAGVTAVTCTYPLDMVRARMAVAGRKKYKNLISTLILIYQQEGWRCFCNGFIPTVIGIIPYAGTSFFVNEALKSLFHDNHPGEDIPILYRLLFGAFAGFCGQSICYPLDVVRRRQQTDGLDGKGYKYRSLRGTWKYIRETEGVIKGLYKGLSMNLIKGPLAVGVSFATKDMIQMFIEK